MPGAEDRTEVYEQFRAVGRHHADDVFRCWQQRAFPEALWADLGERKVLSVATSRERGLTSGASWLAAVFEGVTRETLDGGFMISVAVHGVFGLGLIDRCAPAEVRERYLDRLSDGREILAFAVTEHHGGTDALNPRTRVSAATGSGSVAITGSKWHITNAPLASVILVLARNDSDQLVAAIVDRELPGVTIGEPLHPAGARTSPVAAMWFDEVVLPDDHVFRISVDGANVLKHVLTAEKILGAFPAIGLMDGVLAESLSFARRRSSGGRRLTQLQHVQYRLTEMRMTVEMIRGFAHSILRRFEAGDDVTLEAAALKHQAMKLGVETGLHAIKLCGSYGLQEESRLPMAMLDGLAGTIGGGTEEAQRLTIFAEMIRRRE